MPKGRKRPFLLYEGRCADDNHLRITNDMLTSEEFITLSSSAKVLYTYMRLWSKGRDSVQYAASLTKSFMAHTTFARARDELIAAGFIYWRNKPVSSNAKDEAGIFEFSSSWHTKKPHCSEPP